MTGQQDRAPGREPTARWTRLFQPTKRTMLIAFLVVVTGIVVVGTRDDTAARLTDSYRECASGATGVSVDELDVTVEAPGGLPLVVVGGFEQIPEDVHAECFDLIAAEARAAQSGSSATRR